MSGVRIPAPPLARTPAPRRRPIIRTLARNPKLRPVRLYRELRRALLGPCAVARGTRLLVACSGGPDSLALLVGLHELSPRLGLRLTVAHLDHGLRPGSALHARSVERRAGALGLPFLGDRISARRRMRERSLSGEAGLRTLRREFLESAARRCQADFIVLGHTLDDQAETVLLRLVRGTRNPGLSGMRWRHGRWLRPLLGVCRSDVTEFLKSRRLRARQDPSNRDRRIARNLIRLDILPRLRRLNPLVAASLAATADRLRLLSEFITGRAALALKRATVPDPGDGFRLVRKKLLGYHPAIRESVILQAWERNCPRSAGLTRRHLQAIESLLKMGVGRSRVNLPGNRIARLERGLLILSDNPRLRAGSFREHTHPRKNRTRS